MAQAQVRRPKAQKAFLQSHVFFAAAATTTTLSVLIWIMAIHSAEHVVLEPKYLYWGPRVDCPGKQCLECGGLGHQESSLRCALEEALFLNRTFVLPSWMCVVGKHNDRGLLGPASSAARWEEGSCRMDSLYDLDLISNTIRVITDSSEEWHSSVQKTMQRQGALVHVQGITRYELSRSPTYSNAIIINRTATFLAWFVECKDRKNRSAVMLPYTFLPAMAAKPLREAAEKINKALGDYDAMHVRRGDVLKTRKDRFGEIRTKFPHLDRDTQPEAIMQRISAWIPDGRVLYIASNEKRPDYFDPLRSRYRVARSSNFSDMLQPVIHNNYQLFMVDRLVLSGGKTVIQTFKENPGDLSLTDDEKKVVKWEKPVHTFDSPRVQ